MSSEASISPLEVKAIRDTTAENLADVLDHPAAGADVAWLERVALMLLPAFDAPEMPDEARSALPDALEQRADRVAAVMLAVLEAYGREPLAHMAGSALARLAERGIEPDRGAAGLALRDLRRGRVGEGELIVANMRRPRHRGVQAALVEFEHWDCGPVVVGGMLTEPAPAAEAGALLDGLATDLEAVDADELIASLGSAVDHMAAHDLALPGELGAVMPLLARALTGDAAGLGELHYELPDAGRENAPAGEPYVVDAAEDEDGFFAAVEELRDRFQAYAKASITPPSPVWEAGDFVVSSMLEWKGGYGDGRLVHWTRGGIAECLLEFFPRKVSADDYVIERAPACAAAFMEFLAAAKLLAGDPVEALSGLCAELRPEFEAACRDTRKWGLAKSVAMRMIADGVDPGDERAVAAWMADFNIGLREDRDRVAGPALETMSAGRSPVRARRPAGARRAKRTAAKA
ncbi:MAG: hypothetical protein ACRDM7_08240, partial [Thermoleophilaceae bacterium]